MKKHGLLKILTAILLLIIVASYFITGRSGTTDYLGLVDVLNNGYQSIYYFFYMIIFIICIGGFYGILDKVPAYKKLLDNITIKTKPLGKKFIFVVILVLSVISAFTGMTLPMLIFVPFLISIILLLGYDKLVAISSTILSILIGYMGGIFVTIFDSSSSSMITYESFVGLDDSFANLFPKILLLFAGITLLIYFVNNHIKNIEKKKVKYELPDDSEVLIKEIKSDYKSIKTWPIIIMFVLLFVILTLGMIPWNDLFEIKIFQEFHTWLTELSINDFAIIPNIISSQLFAFGEWNKYGDAMLYMNLSSLLIVFTLITMIIGKIKINDAIDNYVEGVKKVVPATILIAIVYTILICTYNNGFFDTIVSKSKFNYALSSLLAFLGCILHADIFYIVLGTFSPILNLVTDESIYESLAILFQGIYSIFSIVGPTSIILIFTLSYTNVPYTTWLKYIWRFILALVVLLALVTLIVVLL